MKNIIGTGYDLYFNADGITVNELIEALSCVEDKDALVVVGRHGTDLIDLSPACFAQEFKVKRADNSSSYISEHSPEWEETTDTPITAVYLR